MKKIHILESQILNESQYFEAGTDHPYFEDERTGQSYEAYWNGDYGFPFGYWPETYGGRELFSIGDSYTTHENACGKMAKRYFYNVKKEIMEEEITYFTDALEDLIADFKTYGYTYDENNDVYVSSDGSDEIDLDEWVDDNCYSLDRDKAKEIAEDVINGGSIPYADELAEEIASDDAEYYDFSDRKSIDQALEDIGSDFDSYFESGRNEGRIWPQLKMIGFYNTEQPDPQTLTDIMRDLANTGIVTYEDLLQYDMVFEDWRNDGQITACTLSDYIDGNYGPDSYEDEEDNDEENEIQYARDGKTQFVPHLANQDQKREFFRDFRNTRDQAVYVPREKGAGSLARYHAMRYPYGESKKKLGKIIREEIKKLLSIEYETSLGNAINQLQPMKLKTENKQYKSNTNMNKKLIRLTESDLHNIVKESVNKVLTELDWRTYANAAKKRDAQIQQLGRNATDKGGNRLTHLRNDLDYAASDALTSKYAQRHNNGYPTNNSDVYTKNGYQTVTTNNFDGKGRWSRGEFNYDNKGNIDKQGYNIDSQMDNEVEDYMKGKSKYVNGKGWQ